MRHIFKMAAGSGSRGAVVVVEVVVVVVEEVMACSHLDTRPC